MEDSQEYFWGCKLTKEKPTFTWTVNDGEEEGDEDYLVHTLFLKHAVLGTSAVKSERNVVQIETKNFDKEQLKMPLLSLTLGQSDMCNLDVSFGSENPVILTLVEGNGPVCISGQQLAEFPADETSQDESALETEEELNEAEEEDEEAVADSKKRKAPTKATSKPKKGKMDESISSEEEEDEVQDSDDEMDEEDMDEESSPEKSSKKKAGKKEKETDKKTKAMKGKLSPMAKKAPKKASKKVGKK